MQGQGRPCRCFLRPCLLEPARPSAAGGWWMDVHVPAQCSPSSSRTNKSDNPVHTCSHHYHHHHHSINTHAHNIHNKQRTMRTYIATTASVHHCFRLIRRRPGAQLPLKRCCKLCTSRIRMTHHHHHHHNTHAHDIGNRRRIRVMLCNDVVRVGAINTDIACIHSQDFGPIDVPARSFPLDVRVKVDASNLPGKYTAVVIGCCLNFPRRLIFFLTATFKVRPAWKLQFASFAATLGHGTRSQLTESVEMDLWRPFQ